MAKLTWMQWLNNFVISDISTLFEEGKGEDGEQLVYRLQSYILLGFHSQVLLARVKD